jgi:hypothetical protein
MYGLIPGLTTYTASQMLSINSGGPLCYNYSPGISPDNRRNSLIRRTPLHPTLKLKPIVKMTEYWAKQMRFNNYQMEMIRNNEKLFDSYIYYLNQNSSYVSPACIIANVATFNRKWRLKRSSVHNSDRFERFDAYLRNVSKAI